MRYKPKVDIPARGWLISLILSAIIWAAIIGLIYFAFDMGSRITEHFTAPDQTIATAGMAK